VVIERSRDKYIIVLYTRFLEEVGDLVLDVIG